ncbi:uncharacterized protein LOC128748806 [Synchiropus splendidus]|uniref:uncharacterized protein LOC128748806 n=1 Tax=Synchiropus splendidus TaxID=270530 RepID=UPI00237DCB7D|nr:uncharacterized protein LOC128748806 [Synchiropus splendidus]
MKGLDILRVLWVTKTLTSLLCGAQITTVILPGPLNQTSQEGNSTASHVTAPFDLSPNVTSESTPLTTSSAEVNTVYKGQTTQSTSGRTTDCSAPSQSSYRQQCLPLLMLNGGLILATVILLISTVLLTWKVCHLNRRIKTLSSDADLISNCEYWMGSSQRRKHKTAAVATDNVLLLDQFRQPQEEVSNDVVKEENVPEVEQKREQKKESDEASATPDEKEDIVTETEKTDTKLPEVATSQSANATAPTSAEGEKNVA